MALGINDLDVYDDDVIENNNIDLDGQQEEDYEQVTEEVTQQEEEKDIVKELLKLQGIEDPSSINFENEDGSIEKLNWSDLTLEEQLNILNTKDSKPVENINPEFGDDFLSLAQELQDRAKLLEGMETQNINQENPFDQNNQVLAESIRMVARLLDRLIDLSYGKRSEDGLRFIKSKEVLDEFKSSIAYEAFIEQMLSNQEEMVEFINKLVAN